MGDWWHFITRGAFQKHLWDFKSKFFYLDRCWDWRALRFKSWKSVPPPPPPPPPHHHHHHHHPTPHPPARPKVIQMRPMWLWQCLAAQLCRVAVSNIFWIYYFLFFEWFRQFDSCTFIHYNIKNFPRCFEIWFMFFFALWLFLIFHVTIVSKPYNCLNIIIGKWLLITFCELDVKKVLSSLSIRFIEFFFFFLLYQIKDQPCWYFCLYCKFGSDLINQHI